MALKDAIWDAPREAGSGAVTTRGAVTPDPAGDAREDKPLVSIEDCHHNQAATEVLGCVHGDPDGGRRAVLVGDSKAAQWFPALDTIAEREGWRLEVLTKSACSFHPGTPAADYPECDAFNVALLDRLMADPPDLVLTTGSAQPDADGYVRPWRELRRAGVDRVVALYNSPRPTVPGLEKGTDLLECMGPLGGTGYARCAYDARPASRALRAAVEEVSGATYVDMQDWVCPPSTLSPECPPVIAGVLVYRSGSHLTDTFVSTLTDPLHHRLWEAGVASEPPEPESRYVRLRSAAELIRNLAVDLGRAVARGW